MTFTSVWHVTLNSHNLFRTSSRQGIFENLFNKFPSFNHIVFFNNKPSLPRKCINTNSYSFHV